MIHPDLCLLLEISGYSIRTLTTAKRNYDPMEKMVCTSCGYVYDQSKGDPERGIPPGTSFEDIPESWVCPICYAGKDAFDVL